MRLALSLPLAAILGYLCLAPSARGGEGDAVQKPVTQQEVINASEDHDRLTQAYYHAQSDLVAVDLWKEMREAYWRWKDLSEAQQSGISFREQLNRRGQTGFGSLHDGLRQEAEYYERLALIARTDAAAQHFFAKMNQANKYAAEEMDRFLKNKKEKAGEAPK